MISGHIIKKEILSVFNISQRHAAWNMNISKSHFNDIIHGKKRITPDMAIRLSLSFGKSPLFWLTLQNKEEIQQEYEEKNLLDYSNIKKLCVWQDEVEKERALCGEVN